MKIMSRSLWAGVFLLALTVAQPVRAQLATGDAAVAHFDLDGAIRAYQTALSQKPYDYEASWKLARSLLDQATLTNDPVKQKSLIAEGEVLARRALQSAANDSKGHLYLAIAVGKRALFEGGKRKIELSKEVQIEAEKSIALHAGEDAAYHVLAVWHREMATLNFLLKNFAEFFYGKFPPASLADAEKNLRKAVELAPTVVAHQVELGITLRTAGKRDEARTTLEGALKLPKSWVTDDHYKALATVNLSHLKK
jgi:tetratricopeptide (TPR) repeat protein